MNVACAIIIKDSKVLLCQRNSKKSLPLKWEFPGGKQENNETLQECLLRELKEELNIQIIIKEQLPISEHKYTFAEIKLHPFICHIKFGKIKLNEHLAFEWCNLADIRNFDLADADVPILNHLLERKSF